MTRRLDHRPEYQPHAGRDYCEIGTLSTHSEVALKKFARHASEMAQG